MSIVDKYIREDAPCQVRNIFCPSPEPHIQTHKLVFCLLWILKGLDTKLKERASGGLGFTTTNSFPLVYPDPVFSRFPYSRFPVVASLVESLC